MSSRVHHPDVRNGLTVDAVADATAPSDSGVTAADGSDATWSWPRTRSILWRLTRETTSSCFRYRVTGLAAEAGFFALLSLPPLVLGLVGSIGYLGKWVGAATVTQVREEIITLAGQVLTPDSVRSVIQPTLDDVFTDGRFDIISIGFVIALWSGSRALNVFIDTISIMYGLGGVRGIIRTRALSFSLYVVALLIGIVVVPLVLVGPTLLGRLLPEQLDFLISLYWLVTPALTIISLTSLYHIAAPIRTPWRRDVPGAVLTLLIWFGGSYVIRWIISVSVGGASIYGPLAAPIVVMIWLYVLAIAVLIGAALNAAVESVWPVRPPFVRAPSSSDHSRPSRTRRADDADPDAVVDAPEDQPVERPGSPPPNRTPLENPLAPLAEPR